MNTMRISGFELASNVAERMVPRLIVNLEGREKEGKTHFALTAPKPLAYLNFDKSSAEDVMRKFREQQIFAKNYWPTSTDQASYQVIWEMFRRDYDALLQSDVRTIVLDTGTEIYNISRMAEFGKLTQVMPHQYARVNSVFRQLFNDAYTTEKNIVIVHKKKKEYIENDWTGKWERSGFSETGFLVQINVECRRDPQPPYDFVAQVLNCSLNGDLMGLELRNGMNSFPTLAQLAIPDSKPEDWQ